MMRLDVGKAAMGATGEQPEEDQSQGRGTWRPAGGGGACGSCGGVSRGQAGQFVQGKSSSGQGEA